MALTPGTRLGVYEVTAPIGEGGMGQVYRATDTTLGRQVAIKILPDAFAADPERLARFEREAKTLASLNHPHIAAIYGFEKSGGTHALVMELVEGEDLSQRIARGAISIDEALPMAKQIAEALEAAHEQGIIHRDLKPANIKARDDGTVKVLDFGLAKAMDPTAGSSPGISMSPTLTTPMMTGMGMILGTAPYMSPEQAKGRVVDKRTDVWAFGCVFFEMLTGRRAFEGEDVTDTIAAVVRGEPDWGLLPADVPEQIRLLLTRCLTKDRRARIADISLARFLMTETLSAVAVAAEPATPVAPPKPLWRRAAPVLAVAIVTALVASFAAWNLKPSSAAPGGPTRFPMILPDDLQFIRTGGKLLAISPDGTRVVYQGNRQLFLRSMADMDARPIPGTSSLDPVHPFFSPDGQWVGFLSLADATVKKIAVSGGAPVTLYKFGVIASGDFIAPRWDGDEILFAQQNKGIMRLSANGGEPQVLVPIDAPATAYGPQLLPGGKSVLFSLATDQGADRWDTAQIVVQSLTSSERKVVFRGGGAAQYVPTGHLVYALGTTLLAIPFDLGKLEVRGGPVPILEGVRRGTATTGAASFALSTTGSLVYVPGSSLASSPQTLALADRTGKVQPLGLPPQPYYHPRISPDGTQMVFGTDDGKESIVWVADLKVGASVRRLTFGGKNMYPIWSRDGRFITFQSDREGDRGLFRQPADGSGTAERLTKADNGAEHRPEDWSPDGKTLLVLVSKGNGDLWTLTLDGDRTLKPLVQLPSNERYAAFSPDGRFFTYASTEIGSRFEIFVQPFPTTGAKYQISTDGGRDPLWSPDGKQLLYNAVFNSSLTGNTGSTAASAGKLGVVDVRTQPAFSFGRPTPIPIERAILGGNGRYYDMTPDGKQFLVVMPPGAQGEAARPPAERINVVLNWLEELKQRVPMK